MFNWFFNKSPADILAELPPQPVYEYAVYAPPRLRNARIPKKFKTRPMAWAKPATRLADHVYKIYTSSHSKFGYAWCYIDGLLEYRRQGAGPWAALGELVTHLSNTDDIVSIDLICKDAVPIDVITAAMRGRG